MRFRDRSDAGERLARLLTPLAAARPLILALPRGGVPVAAEVARALGAPLEVFVARKIGAPQQPELGIGAVAEGGVVWVDPDIGRALGIEAADVEALARRAHVAVGEAVERFRGGRPLPDVAGRTVVLIDDGLATGSTARAAIAALRLRRPRRIVFAAPVAAAQTAERLRHEVDALVAVAEPTQMSAVGQWYQDFRQLDDDEVHDLLAAAGAPPAEEVDAATAPADDDDDAAVLEALAAPTTRAIEIALDGLTLSGDLTTPVHPRGLIVFAHGSGSGRRSPRNRSVASVLVEAGFATLLFDLLSDEEQTVGVTGRLRFDIPRLAGRLVAVTDALRQRSDAGAWPLGFFGASTGAAAALIAAAARPERVMAVVSRGGRVDLADGMLPRVRAPTLLLVGSEDDVVLELNRRAYAQLGGDKQLLVVEGAGHLFEEPGALERVARVSADWFTQAFEAHAAEARP
jgi:putative phosphoribosyl transferase